MAQQGSLAHSGAWSWSISIQHCYWYLQKKYGLIFADAVLEHLTDDQINEAFPKIYDALVDNGTFAFSVRQGDGESLSTEKLDEVRYFQLWQLSQLLKKLEPIGFNIESTVESVGYQAIKRLYIIASKKAL